MIHVVMDIIALCDSKALCNPNVLSKDELVLQ